jgi:hypothetical protein
VPTRTGTRARSCVAAVALASAALAASCRVAQDPIRVDRGRLVVENMTRDEWLDVSVTLNAYYHGGARTLLPGGRLEGPLTNFVTGLGQRFDPARERVRVVEVRARTAGGRPVTLDRTFVVGGQR